MERDWTEQLSAYLDGELSAAETRALEARLAESAEARALLAELRAVKARAAALEATPPATDLWPGIAARIAASTEGRSGTDVVPLRRPRRVVPLPQAIAAGVALAIVAGGTAWVIRGRMAASAPVMPASAVSAPTGSITPRALAAAAREAAGSATYDAAVTELQQVLERNRARLDTVTVRVLEKNLAIIDQAIAEAERALAADPANSYLTSHLIQARRRKLQLLQQAASIAFTAS